ncbi:hypothetical protein JZ751_001149 [Albula glossodonta]|uniref:Uncharacterized protein n=1 Tax=Albula glossodonta TaxID=121402 RepID=A0A8T2PSW3_9TELE|nr:hypothetical protein JZ751_001149 [Albula glossodonta]
MASSNLLTQRDEIRRQVEALEQCLDTDGVGDSIDISDSDEESEDGEQQALGVENLMAKREQIQSEIRELELTLSRDMASEEDSDEELALPSNAETCLQMNLVYQDILEEKLTELERLLVENQEQQKEVMVQLSGPAAPQATSSGLPPLKVFLGNFMKPYFKDKVTGLGKAGKRL